ncbi:MAG: hypothetical protein IJA44_02845 [Clostridia bacterium]|nr:hypothetical protein [Clostridia bacterium]
MAKDLYAIILKDLGKKAQRVKEELISYGTPENDTDIIIEKVENDKPCSIAYAKTFAEAKLLKERFEGCGAVVDVCLKRAFKEKKITKGGTPLYDALCEGFEKYAKTRKELKKNLAFCVIGWPLLAIGICLLIFANYWGLLPLIAGAVILDVSAFKLMLENNKKKKAETNEDDLATETKGQKAFRIILEILKYIGVILFGAFVVLYRICKILLKINKINRKYKLIMPFTQTASFDILISFAVFAVFLLAALICYEIAQAIK